MNSPRANAGRLITATAAVAIVVQLVLRGLLVARGNFYWDDLILIAQASSQPILSWDYLGHGHDGHFMPAAYLVAGLTTAAAPVQWWPAALTLVLGQAIASIAVWRMIRILAPAATWGALAALAFYLFVPMTVPAFAWWAAGLNTLPMQAATAVVVANAVALVRGTGPNPRLLTAGAVVAFVIALAFFEKALFIAPVAVGAGWLASRADPGAAPGRARALWAWLGGISGAWVLLYAVAADPFTGGHSLGQTARLTGRSIGAGLLPSLAGGPWRWGRWSTAPPIGEPGPWLIAAGAAAAAAVAVWARLGRRGGLLIVGCAAAYAVAAQLPVLWNRSSAQTAEELAQTLRYLPDTAVVATAALALLLAAPVRRRLPGATVVAAVGVPLAVGSSLVATAGFAGAWYDDPTGAYLARARASLSGRPDLVMFDQPLPLEVLTPVAAPDNRISRVFGRVPGRPRFGDHTERLLVLDETGALVPGGVSPVREVFPGPGSCRRPPPSGPATAHLSGPLIGWRWTVVLDYCADRDGAVAVALGDAESTVPVRAGRHRIYFQLPGGGSRLTLRPLTRDLALYTGAGRVGEPIVAGYAP